MDHDGERCPCGSDASLGECCGPILRGVRAAPTAERLMRSRFTAFALGEAAHLRRSWHVSTQPPAVQFVPGQRWTGLEIVATEAGGLLDDVGVVEFRASHERDGRRGVLREAVAGGQVAGRVGFFLRVDDFEATYARVEAAGVELLTPPRTEDYGRVTVFRDIAGNRWDLIGPA